MTFARFLLLAALTGLSACAAKPEPPPVVDIASMSCGATLATTAAVPLLFDPKGADEKITPAVLDGKSSCLQEADGSRRLYQVFTLPAMDAPYIIAMRSPPWGETILAPRLLLLGADGQVMRSTTHSDFVFRGEELSALLRSHPQEVYLVVTSDSDVLGKEITRVVEAVHSSVAVVGPRGGAVYWYSGSDATNHMVLSAAGRIEITITPFPKEKEKK